ncbi:MAG: hypothetical protein K9J47_03825 [Sulfuritalea sp.]|nr:hypothetical protein [Polynucleobacter sp.]MCF8187884.1 hypothetical protein [Sulfuritalea sp.]
MSLSTTPPLDTSNPAAVQGIFTTNLQTPRRKLSQDDKTLTTRKTRLLQAHASSPQFKVNPKNNKNSSQVDTDSQKTSGTSEKNNNLKNSSNSKHSDIKGSDENSSDDEDSIVSEADSSDDDLEDLMPTERREKIENNLIQPWTRVKKADFERQEEKETAAVREARIRKYAMDFVAGSLLQLTSFGIGGFATIGTGNPGLFPVVVPFMNELLSEKIAQLTRTSTIGIPETQQWFAIQRQLGHALGDLFVACANKDPSKKFDIKVNGEIKKVTAAEALKHMGLVGGFKAWGKNFLVRGLPFAWFTALYAVRDWQLYDAHGGYFSGNATKWCHSYTPNANCTNVEQPTGAIDPVILRTGIVFLVGMLAGAATSLTGQLIASQIDGAVEKPNFSTDYYIKKMSYLESLKLDIKTYIDNLSPKSYDYVNKLSAAIDLENSIDKEMSYAKKKSSLWTTYQAEFDLATQKKRDTTMVTPEFGSKRIDTGMAFIGKMLSLILYVGIIQRFSPQSPHTNELDRQLSLILPPLMLIFIAGYAHRDDLRIIPQTIYGAGKGIVRACKVSAKHAHGHDHSTQTENDHVVNMEGALSNDSDSEEEKEPYLSNGLTNPDGTPMEEKGSPSSKAHMKSQHDSDDDSIV